MALAARGDVSDTPTSEGRRSKAEAVQLVAVLVACWALAFGLYLVGFAVPRGDFFGTYLTEAQVWWGQGGMVSPPQWTDHVWMGYPAPALLQNAAFYLPVGVMHTVAEYTPWSAAVLSSAHVAWGSVGCYVLSRRLGVGAGRSLLAMVAYFFCPIFFANAQHLDFVWGAAWVPWVMLVASPLWPWHRWWAVVGGTAIFTLWLLGAYPGQLALGAYILAAWALMWSIRGAAKESQLPAGRDWLPRLGLVGGLSIAIAVVKFGPALQFMSEERSVSAQEAGWSWATLPTIFFPYDSVEGLPLDVSMRPLFVVAPALALALLAWRRSPVPVRGTTILVVVLSMLASLPTNVLTAVPGGTLSRFQVVDMKPFLTCLLAVLSAIGLDVWVREERARPRLVCGFLLVTAIVLGATHAPWTSATTLAKYVVTIAIVALSAWVLARARGTFRLLDRYPVAPVIILAIVSGLGFAYTTTGPWLAKREKAETANYGFTVDELIARSECETPFKKRPERIAGERVRADGGGTLALRGAWSCEVAVGGYVNHKGVEVMHRQALALAKEPDDDRLVRFYSAGGAVVPLVAQELSDLSDACLKGGQCEGLGVEPVRYDRQGLIVYRLTADVQQTVAFNESNYPGWAAEICDRSGSECRTADVAVGPGESVALQLPAGTHIVILEYSVPNYRRWEVVALLAALGVAFWSAIAWIRGRRGAIRAAAGARVGPEDVQSRVSLR